MDVWITHCKRTAKCRWCEQPIIKGEPMVVGKVWRKGNPNERKWNIKLYWHPNCWLAQALDYLRRTPFVSAGGRGRPKLKLSEEDTKTRYLLLRRKSALEQRRRKLKCVYPDRILAEARIDARIEELAKEMEEVGGVPRKWKVV